MRIGILGGTFNPIHIGHLVLAEAARRQHRLDQIWFIPTAMPPHKTALELAGGAHRLAMVRLAVRGHPAFKVRDVELRRGGLSYTLETVRALQQRHPRHVWFLIIGADMLAARWYGLPELARRCTFLVAGRAGADVRRRFSRMRRLTMPTLDISSSMIRTALRRGHSVCYLVPEAVERYLRRHRLYHS